MWCFQPSMDVPNSTLSGCEHEPQRQFMRLRTTAAPSQDHAEGADHGGRPAFWAGLAPHPVRLSGQMFFFSRFLECSLAAAVVALLWAESEKTKKRFDPFQDRSKNCSPKTGKFPIPIKYRNCNFFSVS